MDNIIYSPVKFCDFWWNQHYCSNKKNQTHGKTMKTDIWKFVYRHMNTKYYNGFVMCLKKIDQYIQEQGF